MKVIEVDVDYGYDVCDLDEVDVDDVGDVKKCRRCCVDEVTISIWQQFFGNKKTSLELAGKRTGRRHNFSSFSPFLSKHWTFVQESGISTIRLAILGLWRFPGPKISSPKIHPFMANLSS
jgi:hypothetical protein